MGFLSDLIDGFGALGKWLKHEHPADRVDNSEPASGDSTEASDDSTNASGD